MKFLWNGNGELMTAQYVWKDSPEIQNTANETVDRLHKADADLSKLDIKSETAIDKKEIANEIELAQKMKPILDRYEQLVAEATKEKLGGKNWKNKTLADQFRIMTRFEKQSKESLLKKAISWDETNLKIAMAVGIITAPGRDKPVEIPGFKNKDGNPRAFHNQWAKLAHGAFWGVLAGGVFSNPAVMSVTQSMLEGAGAVGKVVAGEAIHAINDPMSAIDSVMDSVSQGSVDPALDFANTGRSRKENAHLALEESMNPLILRKHFDYAEPVDDVLDKIETFQKNSKKYPKYAESEFAQKELLAMAPESAKVVARLAKNTFTPKQVWEFQLAVQRADEVGAGDVEKLLSTAATNGILGFFVSQSKEVRDEFMECVLDEFRGGNPGGDLNGQKMVLGSPSELKKLAETAEKQGIRGVLSDGFSVNVLKGFGMVYVLLNVVFEEKNLLAAGWNAAKNAETRKKVWRTVTFPLAPYRMIRDGLKKNKLTKEMMDAVLKDGDTGISKQEEYDKFWKTLKKSDRKKIKNELMKATRTDDKKLNWKEAGTLTKKIEDFLGKDVTTGS